MTSHIPTIHELVYRKTEKGKTEIEERQLGLNAKQRSVLIMLDGRKRLADFVSMLAPHELEAVVTVLARLDLVTAQGGSVPCPAAHQIIPVACPDRSSVPDTRLTEIKQMMMQSAQDHLGLLAADVVRKIGQSNNGQELLSVVGQWNMAMHASKHGGQVASAHLETIRGFLHGAAVSSA